MDWEVSTSAGISTTLRASLQQSERASGRSWTDTAVQHEEQESISSLAIEQSACYNAEPAIGAMQSQSQSQPGRDLQLRLIGLFNAVLDPAGFRTRQSWFASDCNIAFS